jgi:hypothetical protein
MRSRPACREMPSGYGIASERAFQPERGRGDAGRSEPRMEPTMKITRAALALIAALALSPAAAAGPDEEVRSLYGRFAAAQNARDLAKVGALFVDSPQFLWVSDGKSIWGREATLARMASFQQAPVWVVEPDLAKAVVVPVSDGTAFLHLPLLLIIGPADAPDRLPFLVSMLCTQTPQGWRIAALFTTGDKPE